MNGTTIVTEAAWNEELNAKHEKLVAWLRDNKLSGVLIRRNENVAWLTGGAVEVRVLTPCETGVASLLVTAKGSVTTSRPRTKRRACTTRSLARSILSRCFFPGTPTILRLQRQSWQAARSDRIRRWPGTTPVNLFPLRASLSETEIARYRWLGTQTADATVESLHAG